MTNIDKKHISSFLQKAELPLLRESVLQLMFPRRCLFCSRVIGFEENCESKDCKAEKARLALENKRLNPATHYFGELEGAAAVYLYEGSARKAILQMKYGGIADTGRDMGNCMAKELFGCTFRRKYGIVDVKHVLQGVAAYHAVIPVPPSDNKRGYNVPEILAKQIAKGLGVELMQSALVRKHFVKRQAGLDLSERFANVAGSFTAQPKLDLSGKNILLVDDVITTGAAVASCAQALLKAGAENVFAVSFAAAKDTNINKADDDL